MVTRIADFQIMDYLYFFNYIFKFVWKNLLILKVNYTMSSILKFLHMLNIPYSYNFSHNACIHKPASKLFHRLQRIHMWTSNQVCVEEPPSPPPLPRHSWTLSLSTADVSLNVISSFVYKKTVKLKEKEPTWKTR